MDIVTQFHCGQQATVPVAASVEDENELSQLFCLANSILDECKDAASLCDLNTAIYLFGEAVNQRPAPHPLRSDSLMDLAAALVTRFNLTNQDQDICQAMSLYSEAVRESHGVLRRTEGQPQSVVRIRSHLNVIACVYHLHREVSPPNTTACSLWKTQKHPS
jgi:hypothetical protein